jgi:hypothetical protein
MLVFLCEILIERVPGYRWCLMFITQALCQDNLYALFFGRSFGMVHVDCGYGVHWMKGFGSLSFCNCCITKSRVVLSEILKILSISKTSLRIRT